MFWVAVLGVIINALSAGLNFAIDRPIIAILNLSCMIFCCFSTSYYSKR